MSEGYSTDWVELDTARRGADSVDSEIKGATSSGGPRGFLTS